MIIDKTNYLNLNNFIDYNNATIVMNKPLNFTSFKLVANVRKICKLSKVGHAGTLDPKATGLMILCTGKETKNIDKFVAKNKTYTGRFELGAKTKSFDSETEIYERADLSKLNIDELKLLQQKFIGEQEQIPPMFSAIKLNGKRLYKIARKGKEVERKPRKIFIEKFNFTNINLPYVDFELICSKGTYVRSLVNSIGEELKVGAYLVSLSRTKIGDYNLSNAITIDDLKNKFEQNVI